MIFFKQLFFKVVIIKKGDLTEKFIFFIYFCNEEWDIKNRKTLVLFKFKFEHIWGAVFSIANRYK